LNNHTTCAVGEIIGLMNSGQIRFEIQRIERLLPWLDRIGQVELAAFRRRQLPRLQAELKRALAWEAQHVEEIEEDYGD
jgi:hypothetical protein